MCGRAVLDNPMWHAITGPQAGLAERVGNAGRFHRDVAPFCAISGDLDAWDDLATLVGPGHRALLFAADVEIPDDWHIDHSFACLQMVAGDLKPRKGIELEDLGPDDVLEMIGLVEATRPGPFGPRTIEMGRYLGHRKDGKLIAMAGERTRLDGYTEISAVCTAEEARGQGLGGELTLAVVEHIRKRGDEAFLHVKDDNHNAISLYKSLGFTLRRDDADVLILAPKES